MTLIRSYRPEPRDLAPFLEVGRSMLTEGKSLEDVLRYLRDGGCHMGDSIDATMSLTGMNHRDAKWAVCHSETWRDMFPAIVQLHDDVERALSQLADDEPELITRSSEVPAKSTR